MASPYELSPQDFPFKQCEILSNLIEIDIPTDNIKAFITGSSTRIRPKVYAFAIVVTQECDLDNDWKGRQKEPIETSLSHILFCELYTKDEIKVQLKQDNNVKLWDWIQSNQHLRYHHFTEASITESCKIQLPELYADFKRIISLPVIYAYEIATQGVIQRKAKLSFVTQRDFIHRFSSYHSRVPLP